MKYFDLHCDTLGFCSGREKDILSGEFHVDLDKNEFESWVQAFAVFIIDDMRGEKGFNAVKKAYEYLNKLCETHPDLVKKVNTYKDIEEASKIGACAAMFTLEGGSGIGDKIENVEKLYEMGIKMITLTWSGSTMLGDGIFVKNPQGLTDFGKDVVREMEKRNMVIDISHASVPLFYDVASFATTPLVASHSNSIEICSHPRNLSDEQFKIIKESGGLVGLNYYDAFLENDKDTASIESLVRHADRFLNLGGENVVALGSDFDGSVMPKDILGIESVKDIESAFLKNFGKEITDKIMYENANSFFKKVL